MDKITFGKRIREVRKSKNFTQEVLAELADIGTVYLGEIERGKKMPSVNVFIRLVNALDISADYLLRDEIKSGKNFVLDDITRKLDGLSPKDRKCISDIIDAYLNNLE